MLKLVLSVVIGLLVLSFFGISLQRIIENPTTQANFEYVGDALEDGWNTIIDEVSGFWENLF
jgi:hypothetical protein